MIKKIQCILKQSDESSSQSSHTWDSVLIPEHVKKRNKELGQYP